MMEAVFASGHRIARKRAQIQGVGVYQDRNYTNQYIECLMNHGNAAGESFFDAIKKEKEWMLS